MEQSQEIRIEYDGKVFVEDSIVDIIVAMRKSRYFYWEIGEALGSKNFPRSRESVRLLCPEKYRGYLKYPELEKEKTFGQSDEAIADNLRVPLSRVLAARRRLGNRKPHPVDIGRRQKWLADKLFGAEPNVRFSSFVRELVSIDGLPDAQRAAVVSFYV